MMENKGKGRTQKIIKCKLPPDWLKIVEKYEYKKKYSWMREKNVIELIRYMKTKKIAKSKIRMALSDLGYNISKSAFYEQLREVENSIFQ